TRSPVFTRLPVLARAPCVPPLFACMLPRSACMLRLPPPPPLFACMLPRLPPPAPRTLVAPEAPPPPPPGASALGAADHPAATIRPPRTAARIWCEQDIDRLLNCP